MSCGGCIASSLGRIDGESPVAKRQSPDAEEAGQRVLTTGDWRLATSD
jgi:hypothetical protein